MPEHTRAVEKSISAPIFRTYHHFSTETPKGAAMGLKRMRFLAMTGLVGASIALTAFGIYWCMN
jgi:hypothetical protein